VQTPVMSPPAVPLGGRS